MGLSTISLLVMGTLVFIQESSRKFRTEGKSSNQLNVELLFN
ncbi:hypothetical protein PR048_028328 [Dryococelus australis]|uniref:Uncharacterized protein n=1 Tax=Dryococelus australis TaxID=614101 RepID=A0ABQ9GJ02_9NEOP|nr:hypothetical protein PR048_028328 [Dryococelus australis]